MNIFEAMQARTKSTPFLTRKIWKSVLCQIEESLIYIQPTDTPEGCLFYDPSEKIPRAGWMSRAEDLLAEDWETMPGF